MNLLQRILSGGRSETRYSFDEWAQDRLTFGGMTYPLLGMSASSDVEEIEASFSAYVQSAYKANGVVFATILARLLLFSEARFQWQELNEGRPGRLWGTRELSILENPWPNGTTGELLARAEQDVSLSGNFYAVREGDRLRRLRPDWVGIVLSAPPTDAVQSDVVGYVYRPGGLIGSDKAKTYLPEEVAHWSPVPDPEAQYRGMSWLSPVIREIVSDKAAQLHKGRFFENAATPNLVVAFKESVTEEQFDAFMEDLREAHQGAHNAYKTLFLAGGADVRVVGSSFEQMDFKRVQGAGETRIAAAGGVPPIIVGLSEGLESATYSNYGMARRKFGDHWARPQWRSICAAMSGLVDVPSGSRLWYDDRDIAFLREDQKDSAEIMQMRANSIAALTREGYTSESVIAAVDRDDLSLLEHTGLFSVQLHPPGTTPPTAGTGTGTGTGNDSQEGDE